MTPEINQIVDLYRGEEPKKRVSLPEEEYGVCSICGGDLGRFDVGSMHRCCEQDTFLGDTRSEFLGNMDTNELFY